VNIAVVGSRSFPIRRGAGYIFEVISHLTPADKVIVRPSEGVDYLAKVMAEALGIEVIVFRSVGGREENFKRDVSLVDYADRVEAFFDPEHVMEGGTGHVVEVAQRMRKPVRAWTVDGEELVLVGSE
jgi:hypothetical protein